MKLCCNGMLDCTKYSVLRILFDKVIKCGHQASSYYLLSLTKF